MVQKSKILGKPTLIFVTVGTTPFQFRRLFLALDNALKLLPNKPKLIIQSENFSFQWQYKKVSKYTCLAPKKLINVIKTADKIITHASPAILYLISKYSNIMPLVIARNSIFREHASNHQVQFNDFVMHRHPRKLSKYFVCQQHNIETDICNYLLEEKNNNRMLKQIFNQNKKKSITKKIDLYIIK